MTSFINPIHHLCLSATHNNHHISNSTHPLSLSRHSSSSSSSSSSFTPRSLIHPTTTTTSPTTSSILASLPSPSSDAFERTTWHDVETLTDTLVSRIRSTSTTYDCILAVSRGGLIPATFLAQAFELRNVLVTTVLFYTDAGQPFFGLAEPRFLAFPPPAALAGRSVLIVDDVWDTGRTLHAVHSKVMRASPAVVDIAVLHYKQANASKETKERVKPKFFATVTHNWVVYPWEKFSPTTPSCTASPMPMGTKTTKTRQMKQDLDDDNENEDGHKQHTQLVTSPNST